eukprot:scaffold12918_cov98-Isochrysis_galbana.AAC.5
MGRRRGGAGRSRAHAVGGHLAFGLSVSVVHSRSFPSQETRWLHKKGGGMQRAAAHDAARDQEFPPKIK